MRRVGHPVYNQGMNWITRCPECATVYRVVPDQLQAAKGWLRCGQCQHTFDSTGLVIFWPDTALSTDRGLPSVAELQNDALVSERVDIEALLKQKDHSGADISSNASADLRSFEQALSSFKPEIEKAIEQLAAGPLVSSTAENDSAMDEPLIASPPVQRRWTSALMACVLLLAFLGQWIWIDRHALTARWPALDGYFKSVCTAVACESEFTREIDGLVIDASSFIQRDGVFELQWIIRSTARKVVEPRSDSSRKPCARSSASTSGTWAPAAWNKRCTCSQGRTSSCEGGASMTICVGPSCQLTRR